MLIDIPIQLLGMVTKHVIPCWPKMKVATNLSQPALFKEKLSRWTNHIENVTHAALRRAGQTIKNKTNQNTKQNKRGNRIWGIERHGTQ